MDYENFSASLKSLAPMCKPEAVPLWNDFAVECVKMGQYVNFDVIADKSLAAEKWLDALYTGFCAVKKSFGEDTAADLIGLSYEKCCLYPGEMMQAAVLLVNGRDAKDILEMIESGKLDTPSLFSPIPWEEATGIAAPETAALKTSVLVHLNRLEHVSHMEYLGRLEQESKSAIRKTTEERGTDR